MFGRGWLTFAMVACFFMGVLSLGDLVQTLFVRDESILKLVIEATTFFYLSLLHGHVLAMQSELWVRDLERGDGGIP